MINKYVVTNCSTSYKTGRKKLKRKWIYFVSRKDWLPNTHSVVCIVF